MENLSIEEARKRMIAKRFGGNAAGASTGGAGSMRRKKGDHKSAGGKEIRSWETSLVWILALISRGLIALRNCWVPSIDGLLRPFCTMPV
jgi:hypothetical protein